MLDNVFEKINSEQLLTKQEIIELLSLDKQEDIERLFAAADLIRQKYVGEEVHLRGLIEFSNICVKNCNYCGIRKGNKQLKRYRMPVEEILEAACLADSFGYRSVVLQSAEDPYYTIEILENLIKSIKEKTQLAVTLSIGERSKEEYQRLFDAGVDRYLLRFETSNPDLYKKLHPDLIFEDRMRILGWLKEIGYQVGSGVMIGLPEQTIEDLAQDIITFNKLELDMIGVGPYISHQETPLAGNVNGSPDMTLKFIAVTRIMNKDANIPATTALASLRPADGREKGLQVGANVLMPNVTPQKYREMYELYPSKVCINEAAEHCNKCIRNRVTKIGRPVSSEQGHSNTWKKRHQS